MKKTCFYSQSKKVIKLFKIVLISFSILPVLTQGLFAATLSEVGTINEKIQGSNGKTIYLIEEAHVDYGAQKAVAGIAEYLMQKKKVRLFLVEGGWGDISLSYLRSYNTPENRRLVAEQYLRDGKISGEEYLNIVSDASMTLWGIEDEALYTENMDAFLAFEDQAPALQKELAQLRKSLYLLQAKIFSQEFSAFLKKRTAFHEQKMPMMDYLRAVKNYSGNDLSAYPSLKKLFEIQDRSSVDAEKAHHERQLLAGELSRHLTKPELERLNLSETPKDLRAEYRNLKALLRVYRRNPALQEKLPLSHLKAYLPALKASLEIDGTVLFEELEKLEAGLLEEKAETGTQKKLLHILLASENIEKLFALKLTDKEFNTFFNSGAPVEISGWKLWLESAVVEHGVTAAIPDLKVLESGIAPAKAFYNSALLREKAMVRNAMKRLEDSGESSAVMIIGGFHGRAILNELKENRYTVVTMTPKFEARDDAAGHQHYLDILKYKWESNLPAVQNESSRTAASVTKSGSKAVPALIR